MKHPNGSHFSIQLYYVQVSWFSKHSDIVFNAAASSCQSRPTLQTRNPLIFSQAMIIKRALTPNTHTLQKLVHYNGINTYHQYF